MLNNAFKILKKCPRSKQKGRREEWIHEWNLLPHSSDRCACRKGEKKNNFVKKIWLRIDDICGWFFILYIKFKGFNFELR